MGIRITTDDKPVRVFRSDRAGFPTYAIGISKKEGEGWITHYQTVRFRKGVELPDKAEIYIRSAFPTLDTWVKDNQQYKKLVWMILEFAYPVKEYGGYITTEDMLDIPRPTTSQPQQMGFNDLPDSFSAAEDDIPF